MSSTTTAFTSLPLIDVAGLYSSDPAEQRAVADALGKAAREVGFFYITGHRVDRDLRQRLLSQTERFFAEPVDRKMNIFIGKSTNHRGYVPEGEEVMVGGKRDKKEALDLGRDIPADHPDVLAGTPMIGPNQWPDLDGFEDDVAAYYDAVFDLGRTLLKGFSIALGKEPDFFDRFVTNPPSQLRLLHYPFDPNAVDVQGIGAHTDYECFTLLLPTAPGLEVMNGEGEWIDVPLVPDAFVVNIGDMMEVWTNGKFVATSHRVRKVQQERYSFPLFFACDYDTLVEPLADLIEAGEAPRYEPIRAGDHLFAQTVQSFTYLRERLAKGEIVLPENAKALSSFGQVARHDGAKKAANG